MRSIYTYSAAVVVALLFFIHAATAQSELTLYNMPYVPKISAINPAIAPWTNAYVGLPVISHMNFSAGTDFATFSELGFNFKPIQGMVSFNNEEDLLDKILEVSDPLNKFISTNSIDLFSVGNRMKRGFFSFAVSEQVEARLLFPKDLFRLIRDLDADDITELQGRTYDLSELRLTGTHYRTYNASYAYDVSSQLTVGLRVGYIQGLSNVILENQNFRVAVTNDDFQAMGSLTARNAGLQSLYSEEEDEEFDVGEYAFASGNGGLVFGFGGQYRLSPKLDIAASVNNLGAIKWKKRIGQATLTETFTEEQEDYTESLFEVTTDTIAPYRTALPTNFSLQGNYYLLPNISMSALLHSSVVDGIGSTSFSIAGNARLGRFLGATIAYHHIQKKANIGLGASLNLGPLQIYTASDNALNLITGGDVNRVHWTGGIFLTFNRVSRKEHLARLDALNPAQNAEQLAVLPPDDSEAKVSKKAKKLTPAPVATDAGKKETDELKPVVNIDIPEHILAASSTTEPVLQSERASLQSLEEFKQPVAPPVAQSPQLQPTQMQIAAPPTAQAAPVEIQLPPNATVFLELEQDANLYEARSTQSEVLRPMKAGTTVKLREQAGGGWLKVAWGAKTGYMLANVLQLAESQYSSVPVATVEKMLEQQAEQPVIQKPIAEKPFPIEQPAVETYSTSLETSAEPYQLSSFFVTQATSLRRSDTSSSSVILRFREGDRVELLERTNRYWWKVTFRGETGWVKAALLEEL